MQRLKLIVSDDGRLLGDDLDDETVVGDDDVALVRDVFGCDLDDEIVNGEVIDKEIVETVEYLVRKTVSDHIKIKNWYKDIFKYDVDTDSNIEEVKEVRRSPRIANRNGNSIE